MPANPAPKQVALLVTLAAALAYCAWLGAHWLPLDHSDKELAGFVSRLWDVQRELKAGHSLPWWTPNYMSGSSYALNHSQGLYLVTGLLFAQFTSPLVACKLSALLAIFAGAVAMYFCARHFLRNEWAAALAAVAFLLHPEQLIRAAGAEHLGVILWMPFMPLTWWLFARVLETGKFRDAFWCALAVVGMLWAHNKMAFVQFVFLAGYLAYWLWPRRAEVVRHVKTCAIVAGLSAVLGAFIILPGYVEAKYSKLLSGEQDQLKLWQQGYAFKSLLGIVDRNGSATRAATLGVKAKLDAQTYRPTTQAEADALRSNIQRIFALQADSPEKYAGIVALLVLAATALFNHRRADRPLFWFLVAMLMLSVMLATGPTNVWGANAKTWPAIFDLDGVPGITRTVVLAGLATLVAFLVSFTLRKLKTARQRWMAGGALAAFLFVPAFDLLAALPFFKEIRAPFVFYDGPGTFFLALLVGFFVTDTKWERLAPVVAVLMLVDYWPYQKPTRDNGVPAGTLANLRATYGSLAGDKDWVKTYSISGRYFHLLGPSLSGRPQVYEAFYNWMAPLGTGLVNRYAGPELFSLLGARYIVFDKTDPQNDPRVLAQLRPLFTVAQENDDFCVLRNDNAHAYVTGYVRACAFDGALTNSPQLALMLAARNWPLVHGNIPNAAQTYRDGSPVVMPTGNGETVALTDVRLDRPDSQHIRIHLNAPRDCLAVIAESYYPFWKAEVDSKPAELLRVSTAVMGLQLPAGAHDIALRYEPPRAYCVAGVVSALALVAGLGGVIWEIRRRS